MEEAKCIEREDKSKRSWCGKPTFDFVFKGSEHAVMARAQEARLLVCPECAQVVSATLLDWWHKAAVVLSKNDFVDGGGDLNRYGIEGTNGKWFRVTNAAGEVVPPPGVPHGKTWDEVWNELDTD